MSGRKSAPNKTPETSDSPPARVFIVDDHAVVRDGYSLAINEREDLCVCGFAENVAEALERIPSAAPDVVLVDLSLGNESGLDLIGDIVRFRPDLPALVVSMHEESGQALPALKAGARGYVMKKEKMSKVIEGIHTVLRGEIYISEAVKAKALRQVVSPAHEEADPLAHSLTAREREVFSMIGDGLTSREIAAKLYLSPRTIATHKERIRAKLNLKNFARLQLCAFQWKQNTLSP